MQFKSLWIVNANILILDQNFQKRFNKVDNKEKRFSKMYFVKDHKLIDEAHTHQHVNHVILIVCFTNCFILGKLSNQIWYSVSMIPYHSTAFRELFRKLFFQNSRFLLSNLNVGKMTKNQNARKKVRKCQQFWY